jgi:hypothetical protein
MMLIYIILTIFIVGVYLYLAWKDAKKWDWVMIAMIIIPMILRIFRIK